MSVHSSNGVLTGPTKVTATSGPGHDGLLQVSSVCSVGGSDVELMCCDFSTDGKWLACGGSDGIISVLQPLTGQIVYRLHDPHHSRLPVTAVKFKKDNSDKEGVSNLLMAGYSSGYVNLWHFTSQKCLASVNEKRQTLTVAYSPDYKHFASAGSDKSIFIYDATTNKMVNTMEPSMDSTVMDGHMSRVYSLKFHPKDPKILLSGGWDDTVQFWDTRQRHSIRKIVGPHICGDALDIEPFTLNVLTGSWRVENQVEIWDFGSGKLLRELQPSNLNSKVYGCCWVTPSTVLIGGSLSHVVVTIDTESDMVTGKVGPLDHGVYGVGYCSATQTAGFVTGGKVYLCEATHARSKTFLTQEP